MGREVFQPPLSQAARAHLPPPRQLAVPACCDECTDALVGRALEEGAAAVARGGGGSGDAGGAAAAAAAAGALCGINNVSSITSVLRPTVAKQ